MKVLSCKRMERVSTLRRQLNVSGIQKGNKCRCFGAYAPMICAKDV